ncbi:MAG: hypothetical protein ACREEG_00610 [Phenylobacterium sp.]
MGGRGGKSMQEIDLIQAVTSWIGLSYTAAQWWLTATTALVVATYLAAKHIKPWFFSIVILLYVTTSVSAIFEVTVYADMAEAYGRRLTEVRALGHTPRVEVEPGSFPTNINSILNYVVFVLGTFSAATYSFIHWRSVRKSLPQPSAS